MHDDLIHARYGGLVPGSALPVNDTMALMLRHRSVRSYEALRPVPEDLLTALIAAGQSGATSSNMQTASIVVVRDAAMKARLARIATQDFLRDAAVVLCFVADLSRPARIGEMIGSDLFSLPLMSTYVSSTNDCAILGQGIALAAESVGLGTCFIGNLQNDPASVHDLLRLPQQATVVFGLTLGYEVPPLTAVRPRLPQAITVHHEVYSRDGEASGLAQYDEVFLRAERAQGRDTGTWTGRHLTRFADRAYLAGRDRLREVLGRLGFDLR